MFDFEELLNKQTSKRIAKLEEVIKLLQNSFNEDLECSIAHSYLLKCFCRQKSDAENVLAAKALLFLYITVENLEYMEILNPTLRQISFGSNEVKCAAVEMISVACVFADPYSANDLVDKLTPFLNGKITDEFCVSLLDAIGLLTSTCSVSQKLFNLHLPFLSKSNPIRSSAAKNIAMFMDRQEYEIQLRLNRPFEEYIESLHDCADYIKLGKTKAIATSWDHKRRLDILRCVLGSGTLVHISTNPFVECFLSLQTKQIEKTQKIKRN